MFHQLGLEQTPPPARIRSDTPGCTQPETHTHEHTHRHTWRLAYILYAKRKLWEHAETVRNPSRHKCVLMGLIHT